MRSPAPAVTAAGSEARAALALRAEEFVVHVLRGAVTAAGCSFQAAAADASADLKALFEREWERDLRDNPLLATYRGDTRYDELWPDITPAAQEALRNGSVVKRA